MMKILILITILVVCTMPAYEAKKQKTCAGKKCPGNKVCEMIGKGKKGKLMPTCVEPSPPEATNPDPPNRPDRPDPTKRPDRPVPTKRPDRPAPTKKPDRPAPTKKPDTPAVDHCRNNDCQEGEICVPEPKQCVTTPCLQYRCDPDPDQVVVDGPPPEESALSCPEILDIHADCWRKNCDRRCDDSSDCHPSQHCCSGCCMRLAPPKPGTCAAFDWMNSCQAVVTCPQACYLDSDCPGRQKCCCECFSTCVDVELPA